MMQYKSTRISIVISMVMTALLFCALIFITVWLPEVVTSFINVHDNLGTRGDITPLHRSLVLVDAYVMLAVAYLAVSFLFLLLLTVWRGRVFSERATRLVSAVSLCCFAEGILFAALTYYFQLALCAAIAVCFIGLCLRVVKNVLEEATRIKSENDFTI
jgi:hypothetical protein